MFLKNNAGNKFNYLAFQSTFLRNCYNSPQRYYKCSVTGYECNSERFKNYNCIISVNPFHKIRVRRSSFSNATFAHAYQSSTSTMMTHALETNYSINEI